MKLPSRSLAAFGVLTVTTLAQAHPGHGDTDFTWDLDHLVAHPGATVLWLVVGVVVVWTVVRLVGRRRRNSRS